MDAERISIAETCLRAAHDGSLSFPEIVGKLMAAGFEGYTVDYRRNSQTDYLPDGDNVTMDMHPSAGTVAAAFDATEVERLVRWAQANPADYSYVAFCEKAKAAGWRDTSSRSWAAASSISAAPPRPMSSPSQSDEVPWPPSLLAAWLFLNGATVNSPRCR
jgi:hypothetical protein